MTTPTFGTGLGLYIATGSGSSFLIDVDHSVSAPVLAGSLLVQELQQRRYDLSNLDLDVTGVVLAVGSLGCTVTDFTNNGDGTGWILVDLSAGITIRYLTVVAQDRVGNLSSRSNVLAILSEPDGNLSTTFSLQVQPRGHDPVLAQLVAAMPSGSWIDRSDSVVPYVNGTTRFTLRCIRPGAPVQLLVTSLTEGGGDGSAADQRQNVQVVIPDSEKVTVDLHLFRGPNLIVVTDGQNATTLRVSATNFAGIMGGYARVIDRAIARPLRDIEQDLNSPLTTTILQPYAASWFNLLPSVRSLQTIGAKLAARAVVNESRRHSGVRDLLAGLTASTPVLQPVRNPAVTERAVLPLRHSQEAFSGTDAHVWLPNLCLARWAAITQVLLNLPGFRVLELSEREIVVTDPHGTLTRYRFDTQQSSCSTYDLIGTRGCFDNVSIQTVIRSRLRVPICYAQYPLDLVAGSAYPLSMLLDEGGSGGLDPGWDGLDGYSILRRFDSPYALDSYGAVPDSRVRIAHPADDPVLTPAAYQAQVGLRVSIYGVPLCVFDGPVVTSHRLLSLVPPAISVIAGFDILGSTSAAAAYPCGVSIMSIERAFHTATPYAATPTQVLVAGGDQSTMMGDTIVASCEIYDQSTGTWTGTGSMGQARYMHLAVWLDSDKIAVFGGTDDAFLPATSCEVYSLATGLWSGIASMGLSFGRPTGCLINGGTDVFVLDSDGAGTALSAIYNIAGNSWSDTSVYATPADFGSAPQAVLLNDGSVMVLGAPVFADPWTIPVACARYVPGTDTWSTLASPTENDRNQGSLIVLGDGTVFLAGGYNTDATNDPPSPYNILQCERYDPGTDTWSNAGTLTVGRSLPQLVYSSVADKVYIVGGRDGAEVAAVEVYDVVGNTISAAADLSIPRAEFRAVNMSGNHLLASGALLVATAECREMV